MYLHARSRVVCVGMLAVPNSGWASINRPLTTQLISSPPHPTRSLLSAVIVNDMAELNIDASLVKNAGLVQANEELVQLENGCICCTLRADLLREVARLAQTGTFDYCVIESTGIPEPMQVSCSKV